MCDGSALKKLQGVYYQSGRRTGRTLAMVASLRDGDRVVFADTKEAHRVERMCRDKGIEIHALVCQPRDARQLHRRPEMRTVFDHGWVEKFYREAVDDALRWFTDLQLCHGIEPDACRENAEVFPLTHKQGIEND